MRNKDYRHIGKNVGRAVRHAIRSGNIEEAGRALEDGVQGLTNDVNQTLRDLSNAGRRYSFMRNNRSWQGDFQNGANGFQDRYAGTPPSSQQPGVRSAFRSHIPGRISGIICLIFGLVIGIPLLIFDFGMIAVFAAGSVSFAIGIVGTVIGAALTALAFAMAGYGDALRRRARRFARCRDALNGAAFCTVEQLAETVGQSMERTKKDLKKMIASGVCPQGHLDRKETCFMVDDATYERYLEAEKAYTARQAAEQDEKAKEQASPKEAELAAAKKEGRAYLQQIHTTNDALTGEEITKKLDQLETVASRIFLCVEQHPEKLPEIRRFMHYYMPTTIKLLKAYEEFEKQAVQGTNITKTKQEIEQALDTINHAFGNLLDTLYADDAFDISTDISTLETMLKQEGLTGSDFADAPENNKP
ncbi:MAG: 5-bromo-4-chloroindolyl phosphate hydrolysis family protein [Ethanoligenens sp.]